MRIALNIVTILTMLDKTLPFSLIEIKVPRSSEKSPEAAAQLFAAFSSLPKKALFSRKPPVSISFEIVCQNQEISFLIVCPKDRTSFVESQISAQYPQSLLRNLPQDYFPPNPNIDQEKLFLGQLQLSNKFFLPLKTFRENKDTDLLSSLLGTMSKAGPNDFMAIQVLIANPGNWQGYAQGLVEKGIPLGEGKTAPHPQAKYIAEKLSGTGFWTGIRLITNTETSLQSLSSSFAAFQSEINGFKLKKPNRFDQKKLLSSIQNRSFSLVPKNQILNTDELASIWHLPTESVSGIKNIAWGRIIATEAPTNLPTAEGLEEADKKQINFIARTEHKNKMVTFGIKKNDRRRHIYIIGKTGTGKSTLIANMAINDLRNKEGLAVIDPHGDLTEILLDYIPSFRMNETCYLDPSDTEHPFHLNPLEIKNPAHKELIASNIVAIFYKLYYYSWGPRLEHILRNTVLTLLETPQPTLVQIPDLLPIKTSDKKLLINCKIKL